MSDGGQVSVNPKADTVEELQGRRKRLHMGMCKLLRDDLAFLAAARLADLDSDPDGITACATAEFDELLRFQEKVDEVIFNKDEEYKRLMTEVIDGKGHAVLKMDIYFESRAARFGADTLARIRAAPLQRFSSPAAVLELRTGVAEFPWAAVVTERSADIDLGELDASVIPEQALKLVVSALSSNSNVRSVLIKGVRLEFCDGWNTKRLDWRRNEAVQAVPVTAAVLLGSCTCLSNLDLRSLLVLLQDVDLGHACIQSTPFTYTLVVQSPFYAWTYNFAQKPSHAPRFTRPPPPSLIPAQASRVIDTGPGWWVDFFSVP